MARSLNHILWTVFCLVACAPVEPIPLDTPLLDVPESQSYTLEGLTGTAFVIRTEGNIPHIYARNRADLSLVHGFVVASDRFFMLDMARRLSSGTLSEILGQDALEMDVESRGHGMRHIAEQIYADFDLDPTMSKIADAYAHGINEYIIRVKNGELPPPSEYELVGPLLGASEPAELMEPFTRFDVAAGFATIVFELGFETSDARRGISRLALEGRYDGQAYASLRNAGVVDDIWEKVNPVFYTASAPNWTWPEPQPGTPNERSAPNPTTVHVPAIIAERLHQQLDRIDEKLQRDHSTGFGSNAWAVAGSATEDGRSLLASDGHLPLTVAPLFYQLGLDTSHLGGGSVHQLGMVIPGMISMGPGTNGHTAWSQTQLFGDITDWYVEQITLNEDGQPATHLFQGEQRELVAREENYTVRDVPVLGSTGRTEIFHRWETFDGRFLVEIEGRNASADETLEPGEALINIQGAYVVPGDTDGDGIITAISFDYAPLDGTGMFKAVDEFGFARDVDEWRESTRKLVGYSQNMLVSDATGSILYTGYQAVPCRSYLPRDENNRWISGADPGLLIDGTTYGGFSIPRVGYVVDESLNGADPTRCVVPWEEYPWAKDPGQQFLLNANNDPGGLTFDGDLLNESHYIGGPWLEGYRADTIEQQLTAEAQTQTASVVSMQDLQGNHVSRIGEQFTPILLEVIEHAQSAANADDVTESEARMAAQFLEYESELLEVHQRLTDWSARGFSAESGVETFYAAPDTSQQEDAVATMIFNAWYGRFLAGVFNDEGFPSGIWFPTGDSGRQRTIVRFMESRGPHNSQGLSSWNPEMEESAFFDVLGTEEVESSDEVALDALVKGLNFLMETPTGPGVGGFGTEDMDQWLWGLRHWVRFDSVLTEVIGNDPTFAPLTEPFAITPDLLPLADSFDAGDPRRNLPGFPRDGDQLNVDAANPGTSGRSFDYSSGPVFRMVIALGPDGPEGHNILPGGQSGLKDSPYYADQAQRWLANETWPMRFTLEEVLEGAVHRETFHWANHRGE